MSARFTPAMMKMPFTPAANRCGLAKGGEA